MQRVSMVVIVHIRASVAHDRMERFRISKRGSTGQGSHQLRAGGGVREDGVAGARKAARCRVVYRPVLSVEGGGS